MTFKRVLLPLILVLATSFAAEAQTATSPANLAWTAVTKRTDNTNTTGVITYSIFQGAKGSTTKPRVGTAVTGLSTTIQGVSPGTCFEVSAIETVGTVVVESVKSSEACVQAAPNAPTGFTVTVQITVSPQGVVTGVVTP